MLLDRAQQRLLATSAQLRQEVCYVLACAGRLRDAVVMAETARRIVGQTLARTNSDVDAIQAADPELGRSFIDAVTGFGAAARLGRDPMPLS
jgi:hypothetical protein